MTYSNSFNAAQAIVTGTEANPFEVACTIENKMMTAVKEVALTAYGEVTTQSVAISIGLSSFAVTRTMTNQRPAHCKGFTFTAI
jgi:hypothetical protein